MGGTRHSTQAQDDLHQPAIHQQTLQQGYHQVLSHHPDRPRSGATRRGETDRGRGDSHDGDSDPEREGEEAETESGGVNEDCEGALSQVAGDGHGDGEEGQPLAQAVVHLVLGLRAPLTPHGG